MKIPVIGALVVKDITLFYRDKFFGLMTVLALLMYVGFYFVMPRTVDETIELAVFAPQVPGFINQSVEEEGVILKMMDSEESLKQAILDREYEIGIAIPGLDPRNVIRGEKPKIMIYYPSDLGKEMKEMFTLFIGEWINSMIGTPLNIEENEIVLGPDMAGQQIPMRDRILPLFAFMILIMETFGLANLITSEVESGTVRALLVSPMNVTELFVGKGITGILLAFTQTAFYLLATGNLVHQTSLVLFTTLLGSMMFTGMAFFVASISKDMMSNIGWTVILMIAFIIPAMGSFIPGAVSGWMRIIPSYYIIDILSNAIHFDLGWRSNGTNLMSLTGFVILFVGIGIISLRRKLA